MINTWNDLRTDDFIMPTSHITEFYPEDPYADWYNDGTVCGYGFGFALDLQQLRCV